MEYKKLSNGMHIPAIGLGTHGMGGIFEADKSNETNEIRIIKQAIKLGFTHIDTAEIYGQGQAEKEVGIAIKDFDRKDLFITTKVWRTNLGYNNVIKSLKNSLQRLQTDFLDLYLVHSPNPKIPIKNTMEAMELLVEQKKINAIGVSNFSVDEIKEAHKHLRKCTIVANQIEYNLLKRDAEKELIPFCAKNKIMVVSHRPLANGKLANKSIKILDVIAKKHCKTNAQIALKWVISHDNVVAITKSSKTEHLKENADLFEWKLEQKDKELLDKIAQP